MAFESINVGSAANDGSGDSLRAAGQKLNANFLEAINVAAKGAALGVASLDANSRVPHDVLGLAPVFNVKQYGAVGNGTTDDLTAVAAALTAASDAGGGIVYLPVGAYRVSAAITVPAGVVLRGAGLGLAGTRLALDAGAYVLVSSSAVLERVRVVINNSTTVSAIQVNGAGNEPSAGVMVAGASLYNLEVVGGNSATAYAIAIRNAFRLAMRDIDVRTGLNGVLITNDDNVYNYGNGQLDRVEITLTASGRVGWDFDGTQAAKFVNLYETGYISAITGVGTGSTGVRIRNAPYLHFGMLDVEGCATALSIEGGIGGGSAARGVSIDNIYTDGAVTVGGAAEGLAFQGGKITGAISGTGVDTVWWGNVVNASNARIMTRHVGGLEMGTRFGAQPLTIQLRNQTGAQQVAGTIVRHHDTVEGAFRTLTNVTSNEWIGVLTATVAAATNTQVAIAGVADVRVSTAVTFGDFVEVDTANLGQAKGVGSTYPTSPGHLVGVVVKSASAGGVARVLLRRA